ncbi:unnamed protein product [Rotaria magnacalcarata]|uniref:Uncharacterized protein n=3 Tax=Rotaria magnacalcarata TaxID=392030 RepID=A0A816SHI2_9BILA|nr:unnamed protein product [Rotaria magnacalcarata]CAF2085005.1 unnamed protein product [Rotaria magnacalcarata]CAF4027949.1 unnamed protein product [Rotaria magnacalcarata]
MSRTDTNNSHLTSSKTNTNMNSSSLSSSPLSSSSFLSSSYSSPSPPFSKSPPIMNSTGVSSTSVVNHSTGTTSTSGASMAPRSIVKAKRSLDWRYFKLTKNDLLNAEAQADNVHVKSVAQTETQPMVSIENTKKITNCMPQLGPTHVQGDEYSHKLIEEINEAVLEPIKIVVGKTQLQHQQEVIVANLQIQNDFKCKLPQHIVKLDFEKELNIRQERILKSIHKCFNDDLYEDNCLKLMCMDDYMADDIDVIAESDDGENYETNIRRYVVVVPVPPAELAPVDPPAQLASVEPCNRHYFTCGIFIVNLLSGIIIMKIVK